MSRIAAPVSVPLGVGQIPHEQCTFAAPPGSILALYTDGLIETRDSDLDQQIDKACAELQAAYTDELDLDKTADRVIAALLGETKADGFADDVTLLLVRLPDAPVATGMAEFPGDPASVPAGRRFVAGLLDDWDCGQLTDTAILLTSEILTNAVVHGLGSVTLRVRRTQTEVAVVVSDRAGTAAAAAGRADGRIRPGAEPAGDAGRQLGGPGHAGRQGRLVHAQRVRRQVVKLTVMPPEKAESCSSALTALVPAGMSKASSPCTVLPGLTLLKNTLSDPVPLLRSRSALVLTLYFRPLAS